jgi:hypothetical protein
MGMVLQNRSVSIGIVVCHCHAANKKKRQENGSWKIAVYFFCDLCTKRYCYTISLFLFLQNFGGHKMVVLLVAVI